MINLVELLNEEPKCWKMLEFLYQSTITRKAALCPVPTYDSAYSCVTQAARRAFIRWRITCNTFTNVAFTILTLLHSQSRLLILEAMSSR